MILTMDFKPIEDMTLDTFAQRLRVAAALTSGSVDLSLTPQVARQLAHAITVTEAELHAQAAALVAEEIARVTAQLDEAKRAVHGLVIWTLIPIAITGLSGLFLWWQA